MKANITFGGVLAFLLVLILVFLFFYYSRSVKKVFTETINPASDKNIINRGVNTVIQNLTGEPEATLGTKIFDWVDAIKDFLPFAESEREKRERLAKEFLEKRKASLNSTQEKVNNPSPTGIGIKFQGLGETEFSFPEFEEKQ